MIDLFLQAADEAALAAAFPMLRGVGHDGVAVWTAGPHHAVDAGVPIVTRPAVLDAGGAVTTPAVLDPRFSLNLRLDPAHPAVDVIVAAARPFAVDPLHPRRVFA
ncbi:hypothetical protein [Lichenibacterium ramalinae]|uniref:Uncharacterized protein n=1 Tax=Lichenibacterium ramalinae TaxID=2316527 RepID=A0A4Q2RES3_9HYPH|nr:hypothetical protein [Lichenibacterium ramalinae]RYB03956.1 hypothetical protein D3272_15310 [Lichenibacterium ramalinae]